MYVCVYESLVLRERHRFALVAEKLLKTGDTFLYRFHMYVLLAKPQYERAWLWGATWILWGYLLRVQEASLAVAGLESEEGWSFHITAWEQAQPVKQVRNAVSPLPLQFRCLALGISSIPTSYQNRYVCTATKKWKRPPWMCFKMHCCKKTNLCMYVTDDTSRWLCNSISPAMYICLYVLL